MQPASCRSGHRTRGLLGRTARILSIISQRDRSGRPSKEEAGCFRACSCRAAPCGGPRRAVAGSSRRSPCPVPSRRSRAPRSPGRGGRRARSRRDFTPSRSQARLPPALGRPSRTAQARSGHLFCRDHPGSKRLHLIT